MGSQAFQRLDNGHNKKNTGPEGRRTQDPKGRNISHMTADGATYG